MADKVTVTAKTGPASTVTAAVFNDVRVLEIRLADQTLKLTREGGVVQDFDLFGVATVTYTISSHVATIVFS